MVAEGGFALPDDEDVPEDTVTINNIISTYKLNEVEFTQTDFATYFKAYLKRLRKHIKKKVSKERLKVFKEEVKKFGLWIFEKFEELQL